MSNALRCLAAAVAMAAFVAAGMYLDNGDLYMPLALADDETSPIYGVSLPDGYRQWQLVSVHELNGAFQAVLGNPVAIKAYQQRTLPFPEGTKLVKLAWIRTPSTEFDGAFVAGAVSKTGGIEVMVKDSKKYASTGGSGFGRFFKTATGWRTGSISDVRTCFACHVSHLHGTNDNNFTRYSP